HVHLVPWQVVDRHHDVAHDVLWYQEPLDRIASKHTDERVVYHGVAVVEGRQCRGSALGGNRMRDLGRGARGRLRRRRPDRRGVGPPGYSPPNPETTTPRPSPPHPR